MASEIRLHLLDEIENYTFILDSFSFILLRKLFIFKLLVVINL